MEACIPTARYKAWIFSGFIILSFLKSVNVLPTPQHYYKIICFEILNCSWSSAKASLKFIQNTYEKF